MAFNQQVFNLCKQIPKGKVTTYKEIANALNTKAYQAVGNALNKNPFGVWTTKGEDMIPCHRVINSNGFVGGFALGKKAKILSLKQEGIKIIDDKIDLKNYLFKF